MARNTLFSSHPEIMRIFLILAILFATSAVGQNNGSATEEAVKECSELLKKARSFDGTSPDSNYFYAVRSYDCAVAASSMLYQAEALYQIGVSFDERGMFDSSRVQFEGAFKIYDEIQDTAQISQALTALGNTFYYQGDYAKAMEFQQQSLDYARLANDSGQTANTLNNLAILCTEQKFFDQALKHYNEALEIQSVIDTSGYNTGAIYLNIGNIYAQKSDPEMALEFFIKTDSIFSGSGKKYAISLNWSNMAESHIALNNYNKGIELFERAITVQKEINDEFGIAYSQANLAYAYHKIGKTEKALALLEEAKILAEKSGALTILRIIYHNGVRINKEIKNWDRAFQFKELLTEVNDSLLNEETQKTLSQLEALYEHEKKEKQLVEAKEKAGAAELQVTKRNIQLIVSLAVGLGLFSIVVFAFFMIKTKIRSNQLLTATNIEITHKNAVIEERNKELMDSLEYAKRLQAAMFADFDRIKSPFTDKRLLNQPMRIVSGDFFYMKSEGTKTLFAVADCTGHGVPGALLSVVAHTSLDQAVSELGLTTPDKILNRTNELMSSAFNPQLRDGHAGTDAKTVRDGMDISLVQFDSDTHELTFSAANHRILILSKNGELIETRGDSMSLGDPNLESNFTIHKRKMEKGDRVLMFSDGIVDQFGGPKDKKFGIAQLRALLKISHPTLADLEDDLRSTLQDWRGLQPQTDDMLSMMIEV